MSQNNELQAAAQAVLDRWDSQTWNWESQGAKSDLMHALRAALAAQAAQAALAALAAQAAQAALAAQAAQSEPVAKITNKFGDPEAFAERELSMLVDIQKLPIGTKLYIGPAPVRQPLIRAIEAEINQKGSA